MISTPEPDDALNPHAEAEFLDDPPAAEDALDIAYGAAAARRALAEAFSRAEPEAQ